MRKWWLLLVTLAAWIALGCVLGHVRPAHAGADRPRDGGPTRIVSMAPDITEILYALGLDDRIAAVTTDSDYPPAVKSVPKIGTFWQPNIEAIIAVGPDLVATQAFEQQRNITQRLQRMGYPCLTLGIERMDDLYAAIEAIGDATGHAGEARNLVDSLHDRVQQLHTLLQTCDKTKVLWVVQREPLRVAGRDTFIDGVIESAGGQNAIGPTLHKYPPIGSEQVIAMAPDVIIEPTMTNDDPNAQKQAAVRYWSRFANVPAVANNRIYVIDGDIVSRLSPRLVAGIETVAKCLHPEAFAQ